ncbi:hypothetical protein HHK36_011304 [Tetracentron sinense]|uniref:Cytochrome P450 n=1 Tax=Tetracentron sinense TaxID=13715 RepID=A0A834ZA25_TETSI|nr:hypothetical protein HHK36_011304 [Tetracentron sinense]
MYGSRQLPPGPQGWPVFGNMFDLGPVPHQTLASLRQNYGPVLWLRLGIVNTMVVSSAEAAMEMFKNHDISFAGRSITEATRACCYDQGSMAVAQCGPYWRMLRRLCTTELFTNKRISESKNLRRKCINDVIQWISDEAKMTGRVEVARFVSLMSFNLIGNLMLSRDLVDPQSKEGAEFFTLLARFTQWGGSPNIADFFPFLRWLDPQGIRKKMERDLGRGLDIVSRFVKERLQYQNPDQENTKKDFLDVLLEFEGDRKEDEPTKIS